MGLVALTALAFVVTAMAVPGAAAAQVGFKAHSFAGLGAESSGGAITGEKPESKLWFNAGSWWASMVSPTNAGTHTIWRLAGDAWTNTGVVIDTRAASKEDVLSVGSTLYIASRASSGLGGNKLRRFTYAGGSYTPDSGFPVTLPGAGEETLTLARDSTGRLWITYESGSSIFVANSQGSDTSWSAPFVLPVTGATGTSSDDISSVVAFTDDAGPAIGVMWSNQPSNTDYFAVHRDGAPTSTWTVETALTGTKEADDHINLKTSEGRVYAAVKTSQSGSAKQLIRLLVRGQDGTWNRYGVATVAQFNTRPITMLHVDPVQDLVYVFMTIGEGDLANGIAYKVSSTNAISFPSSPTTFIRGPNAEKINNATSMKASADPASGIVVLASDGANYWWNRIGGGGTANTPPTAAAVSASGTQDQPVVVGLGGTDVETCELTFAIVSGPSSGSLSAFTGAPCVAGSPNTDAENVTYTPQPGFTGSDSFTYAVTDGGGATATAVVSLTMGATASGITFRSASSAANSEGTTLTIPAPPGTAPDDVLVAVVSARGNPNLTPPPGWTLVRLDASGFVLRQGVYVRQAGATPPPGYTWTLSSVQSAAGGISAYSGVDPAAPVLTSAGQISSTNSTSSVVAPSITTTTDGAMILGFFGVANNTSVTPPAGMTERFEVVSNAGRYPVTAACAEVLQPLAGATGSKTAVSQTTGWNIGQLVALRRSAS